MSRDLTEALRQMMAGDRNANVVPALKSRGLASAVASSAPLPSAGGGGQGIASPLTEMSYAAREFHAERNITSTDGLVTIKLKPVKSITFSDATGNSAKLIFADPT